MSAELDPTLAEKKLIDAAASGRDADYRTGDSEADAPANGANWGDDRTLRAEIIYALCVGKRPEWKVHAKGVRAVGARIVGNLDFDAATLHAPLILTGCHIDGPISLAEARTRTISFAGSHCGEITADGLVVEGNVFLRNGFVAKGEVRLLGANISGSLVCEGARFENSEGNALSADGIVTKGSVFLHNGFFAEGEVRLLGANIGGSLYCHGARFENSDGNALIFDGLVTKRDVFLRNGFVAKGEVRLLGANIGGNLECDGARFENPEGDALSADGLVTKGDVFLRNGFVAKGKVRLLGANIEGDLDCDGARFENPEGDALSADRLVTKGGVFLRNGFVAKGEVLLLGANIGGNLTCGGARFENPEGNALSADRLVTKGSVFLHNGFVAEGEVRLRGANIGGSLYCDGARFENPSGYALNADIMHVRGALFWREMPSPPEGRVNFGSAKVEQLVDDEASWPAHGKLILDGFVYGSIAGDAPRTAAARIRWLQLQPEGHIRPQPYEQLVRVLRQMGYDKEAREIAIAKQRAIRESGELGWRVWAWSWFLDITIGYGYKPWKSLFYMAAFVIFGALFFADAHQREIMMPVKVQVSDAGPYIACAKSYPCLQPVLYSLDAFLPIVDLHQEKYWLPDSSKQMGWLYRTYLWLHIGFGWILSTVFVAGLTGLVKKD